MSLPSGLIFFLDFVFSDQGAMSDAAGGEKYRLAQRGGDSLYGGGVTGSGIIEGVNLGGGSLDQSFYGLNNGYASPTGSARLQGNTMTKLLSGTFGDSRSQC